MKRIAFITELLVLSLLVTCALFAVITLLPAAGENVAASDASEMAAAAAPRTATSESIAPSVNTVCKESRGAAALSICLHSDGSGVLNVNDGVRAREFVYLFHDGAGECPVAPDGMVINNASWETTDLLRMGFSAADLDSLGLPARYCSYEAAL